MNAKRCCLHILNYRQISENLYFLLSSGTRSPYETSDYQRSTVDRPFFERISDSAAGQLMSLNNFWTNILSLADNVGV
jgi:hypothetical protein